MNILITNDDGISSNGIKALERVLKQKYNTFLIAPLKERSATSQALSIHDKLRVERINFDHYIVDGFPVDCVNIGLHGKVFPNIDIVLSGINRGVNMGNDVHYSGTVGAARHGAIHGRLAFAISSGHFDKSYEYEKEAEFIFELLESRLDFFKTGIVYNINFPTEFDERPEFAAITNLGIRTYDDTYEVNNVYENISEYFLGGSLLGHVVTSGSDFEAFYSGKVSITPINLETTDLKELSELKSQWK
jgi:5'-nucleotidase